MMTNIHFWSYLARSFLEWEMFQWTLQRKPKHTFDVQRRFSENRALFWDNVVNSCTPGQATDDNMMQANFFLDT